MNDNCLQQNGPKKVYAICRLFLKIVMYSHLSVYCNDCNGLFPSAFSFFCLMELDRSKNITFIQLVELRSWGIGEGRGKVFTWRWYTAFKKMALHD